LTLFAVRGEESAFRRRVLFLTLLTFIALC